MKKIRIALIIIICLILSLCIFSSCNSSKDNTYNGSFDNDAEGDSNSSNIIITEDRLIVYNAEIYLSVKNIDNTIKVVSNELEKVEGFVKSTTTFEDGNDAIYIYKVPTKNLDEFLTKLKGEGSVSHQEITSQDITDNYVYAVSKKEALEKELNALNILLDKANEDPASTYEDIVKLTQAIFEVSSKIDEYSTTILDYKKAAEYSTVTVRYYLLDEENSNYFDELSNVLSSSALSIGSIFGFLLKAVVALLPYIGLGILIFLLYVLIKYIVCKIKKIPFTLFKEYKENRKIRKYREEQRQQRKEETLKEIEEQNKNKQ